MKKINRQSLRTFKLTAVAVILAVFCICSTASASNLRVNSTTDGDYSSIQAAIDAADAGDAIFVSPGVYVENIKINKEIRIWSEGNNPDKTVIRAADPTQSTVEISKEGALFSGFGIEGSKKAGILLDEAKSCYINNNKVQGSEYGIYLNDSNNNTIRNNLITLNEKGIRLESSNSNEILNNIIAYNYGPGISLQTSVKNLIYNNYLNNTANVEEKSVNEENIWQSPLITKQNLVKGPYIGGNYWADPEGKGYSQTSLDNNSNGICDMPYNLTGGGADKYPLFPKVPNAVKTLESELNTTAYEQGMAVREAAEININKAKEASESTAKNATNNTTNEGNTSGVKKSPGPGSGIIGLSIGAAYFLTGKNKRQ